MLRDMKTDWVTNYGHRKCLYIGGIQYGLQAQVRNTGRTRNPRGRFPGPECEDFTHQKVTRAMVSTVLEVGGSVFRRQITTQERVEPCVDPIQHVTAAGLSRSLYSLLAMKAMDPLPVNLAR